MSSMDTIIKKDLAKKIENFANKYEINEWKGWQHVKLADRNSLEALTLRELNSLYSLLSAEEKTLIIQRNVKLDLINRIEEWITDNERAVLRGWEHIDLADPHALQKLTPRELNALLADLRMKGSRPVARKAPAKAVSSQPSKEELIKKLNDYIEKYSIDYIEGWAHVDLSNIAALTRLPRKDIETLITVIRSQERSLNQKRSEKQRIADKIESLIAAHRIKEVEGWEHIDFSNIQTIKRLKEWELQSLLKDLTLIESKDTIYIDSLEIIRRHKDGNLNVRASQAAEQITIEQAQWHPFLSDKTKKQIPSWKNDDIDTYYEKVKELYHDQKTTEVAILISNLSELIYERDQSNAKLEEERTADDHDDDAVSEMILFRVEAIIQPHIEVIEKNLKSGGRLKFSNLWDVPFTESLKNEVRERDGFKCAVCESELDLHVHHKIPRNLGGVHHADNLVTLCASCHAIIEKADIQKALVKCLSNYRKNKMMKSINWDLPVNKTQLKLEIEEKLDFLLNQLSHKNEELAKQVVEIIARFDKLNQSE